MVGLCAVVIAGACQTAQGATICVSTASGSGCQPTISKGVLAASNGDVVQVAAGTYKEVVTITTGISLIGAGSATTIIDATGLTNGIVINGGSAGLSGAVVSGFTVKNANYQGILVENASFVTISNNQVLGNDVNLNVSSASGPTCAGLPAALQTGENQDCGEGINLAGADHSVVTNNVVSNNSGGILISDDVGATHDNVISGNLVSNNPYACGITMASHSTMGVYHNTISSNQSLFNGLKVPGAGAGVGVFAAGPGNQTYSNVIIGNTMTGNGLPGVAMHNHAAPKGAPAPNLNDNVIVGNTMSGNGLDFEDAATTGPTGINIFSIAPVTGIIVAENVISNEALGLVFNAPGAITATLNNFTVTTGVDNVGAGTVNAKQDWWGCSAGANSTGCATEVGTGVNVSAPLAAAFASNLLPTSATSSTGGSTGTGGTSTGTTPPAGSPITIMITGPGGAISTTNTFQIYSNQVALNASQSTSTNGGTLSYSWTLAPGNSAAILQGNTATPTFQFTRLGTYQLLLTVTDTTGATSTATITVQYI
jgi:parallel beta-helix repeat protein